MSKSIELGHQLCKYYIEDDQMKVVEGVLVSRSGKKWVAFGSKTVPDEHFPGHRNVGRVWKNGEILWLTERDDVEAKRLFTEYYVAVIKDLQQQIDDVGDRIAMIRSMKIKSGTGRKISKCFGEISEAELTPKQEEWRRQNQEHWDCSEFVDADSYAKRKVEMLKREMFIDLSSEDERHILTLDSRGAIDAAVRAMINKYWAE